MDRVDHPDISTAAMSGDSTGRIVAPKRGRGASKKSSRITAYAPLCAARKGSVARALCRVFLRRPGLGRRLGLIQGRFRAPNATDGGSGSGLDSLARASARESPSAREQPVMGDERFDNHFRIPALSELEKRCVEGARKRRRSEARDDRISRARM